MVDLNILNHIKERKTKTRYEKDIFFPGNVTIKNSTCKPLRISKNLTCNLDILLTHILQVVYSEF